MASQNRHTDHDRRSGKDRRQQEGPPPPGKPERRRGLEPRQPDVIELELSDSEWTALGQAIPPQPSTR